MNVLLPFEEGSFTLVMAKTHSFIIKLIKMQSHSGFVCFFVFFLEKSPFVQAQLLRHQFHIYSLVCRQSRSGEIWQEDGTRGAEWASLFNWIEMHAEFESLIYFFSCLMFTADLRKCSIFLTVSESISETKLDSMGCILAHSSHFFPYVLVHPNLWEQSWILCQKTPGWTPYR